MTLSEFKAWLDGFGEAIGDAPTPEQWAKIREKLATVAEPYVVQMPALPMEPCIPTSPIYPVRPFTIGPGEVFCGGQSNTNPLDNICRN